MRKGALLGYAFWMLRIPVRLDFRLFAALLLASPMCAMALDPNRAMTQYGHDVWTDQNGLPQNSIQAVVQTSDGYIWMGTQEGLVRFDGLRFKVYDRHNTPAMASSNVLALLQDDRGTLWAGLETGGVLRVRDGRLESFGPAQGLSGDPALCFAQGRGHRLWLGTDGGGLNLIENGKVTVFGPKEGLDGAVVYCALEDREGTLWAGTNRGVFRMAGGRFSPLDLGTRERNWFYALAQDRVGTLWIGTLKGLYALSGSSLKRYQRKDGLCSDAIMSLFYEAATDCLWIGTERGLSRHRAGRFECFSDRDGLSNNSVASLFGDAEENLWIGTLHGLNRFRDGKFYTISSRQGLPSDVVYAVCEAPDGSLWVGTDGGGAARMQGETVTPYGRKEGLPETIVNTLWPGRDGVLWAGVDSGGIASFRDGRFVPFQTKDPAFLNTTITSMIQGADGVLWVGAGNGLYRIEGTTLTHFTSKNGLPGRSVNGLLELPGGALAVGTDGGGLALYRGGKFTVLTERDGLASDLVYSLYEDEKGTLWIGTARGLSLLRNGRLSTVTVEQGLFDDAAYVILEDGGGYLWMSCNKGVYRAHKADLEAVADGRLKTLACWSYGRADGMGTNECNGAVQPSGWKLRDGRLCFATMKGVAIIDPSSIKLNNRPPPVVIEEVLLDGRDAARLGHSLPPGKHRLEVRFSALSLVAPDKVRFRYKLEGFDPDWVDGGGKREAVYTGLPPGHYQFRVIACNNDGLWNDKGATFPFTQAPRFYQTGLFIVLCILAGLLVAGGAVALRVRSLKRRQVLLERLVEERTAEVAQANASLQEQRSALQEANLKLERLSKEDGLTGIANRRHFEEALDMEWRRGSRTATPLSVIMIDIDEFKTYNDTLGHQQGDGCLRRVAGTLAGILNRAGDLVARYGGDEFVAVLPSVDAPHALGLAERLRQSVEDLGIAYETSRGGHHLVTVSVGVATSTPTEGGIAEALLAEADSALYRAKDAGRNRVCSA